MLAVNVCTKRSGGALTAGDGRRFPPHCTTSPNAQGKASRFESGRPHWPSFCACSPLESVALDVLGGLPKSCKGELYILVMVDRFSKLCRFLPMRSSSAENVAETFCNKWVFVYGPPKTLLTNSGPHLIPKLFLETCGVLGVRNVFTSTYHSRTNGQTERFYRALESMLRHYVAEEQPCPVATSRHSKPLGSRVRVQPRNAQVDTNHPARPCPVATSRTSGRRKRPGCSSNWRVLIQGDLPATPARGDPLHRQAAEEGAGEVQTGHGQGRSFSESGPTIGCPSLLGRPRHAGLTEGRWQTPDEDRLEDGRAVHRSGERRGGKQPRREMPQRSQTRERAASG